jgi:hypothetical protein
MQNLKPFPTWIVRIFYLEVEKDLQRLGEGRTEGPVLPWSSKLLMWVSLLNGEPLMETV